MKMKDVTLVDVRPALNLVAVIVRWLSLAYVFPLGVALYHREDFLPYAVPMLLAAFLGWSVERFTRSDRELGVREAFLVVPLAWLVIAAFGALPYILASKLSFIDAYFEAMSGFTTTGSSILTSISTNPQALLFWRQFTQWLGGMGIIVLAVAVLPKLAVGGLQLMETEAAGPNVEKLTPRIKHTAQALWKVYLLLTLAQTLALWAAGMSPLIALEHTFTTLASGGFSPFDRGIEETTPLVQWVIIPFMLLGTTSFVLMYRGFTGNFKLFLQDQEFRGHLLIYLSATALMVFLLVPLFPDVWDTLRHGAFQVASIMTTTGFASTDFNLWGDGAKMLLLMLMFVGGMAGSTSGSIKIVRVILIFKFIARELRLVIHSKAVIPIRLGRRVVSQDALSGIMSFSILYVTTFAAGAILLLLDAHRVGLPLSVLEAATAAATTLANTGPAFGFAGPMGSFALFPDTSKVLMVFLMWAGRLELFPVLVLLMREYWKR